MGCCNSKGAGDSSAGRVARWRSTGIVALRDSKLRLLVAFWTWTIKYFRIQNSIFSPVFHGIVTLASVRCFHVAGRISVSEAMVQTLPSEILAVESFVRTLDLTNNRINEVTPEISKLVNMQRLVLANNQIKQLPTTIGILRQLKVIILDGNHLTNLPDELGFLSRLEKLSITGNSLVCLPNTIGNLCNLVLLNVSSNKLKCLPESIGGCISLEELQANDNVIEELPSSVCNLVHLKLLSLNNNLIQQLPQDLLKSCKALQNVSLHENPISMEQFQQMEGFQEFEARRKKKFDKQIDSNVMMSSTGLDEGLDI
ncbi:hypothetical protein ZIOFF_052479 [Zingiber officinale]|uniref:Disease resistance R13L4/SHOC-2-like LRR domain-containing protein n=1 Tax=Zingiber officinale TaxID=94328 RepID=A0A8J5KU43_ZINOF|nr:hypothetical protein ZIOFF_052479 [Zingiber officinale]